MENDYEEIVVHESEEERVLREAEEVRAEQRRIETEKPRPGFNEPGVGDPIWHLAPKKR